MTLTSLSFLTEKILKLHPKVFMHIYITSYTIIISIYTDGILHSVKIRLVDLTKTVELYII